MPGTITYKRVGFQSSSREECDAVARYYAEAQFRSTDDRPVDETDSFFKTDQMFAEVALMEGMGGHTFIAMDGETIVGIIFGTIGPNPNDYSRKQGAIHLFYVSPEYRGRGIGTQLLQRMEEQMGQEGCHKLEFVVIGRFESIPFFQSRKFHLQKYKIKKYF